MMTNSCNTNLPCSAWCLSTSTMSCEACWRKIGVRFHVTVVTQNVLSKFIPEPYRPAHTKSAILEQKSMARSRMDRYCRKAAASTWKSGSLEPRQHVPLIAASAPASPKGHPSPRCRGHEMPLFHAYASACAPGAKKHTDRKKPRCGTGSWYPPLCLQHLEKQRNGAASV